MRRAEGTWLAGIRTVQQLPEAPSPDSRSPVLEEEEMLLPTGGRAGEWKGGVRTPQLRETEEEGENHLVGTNNTQGAVGR